MIKNLIAYGYENNKLWFGRVTFWSWLMAFFKNGWCLEVRPIKGYEQYAYYSDMVFVTFNEAHLTNYYPVKGCPLTAIMNAEGSRNILIDPIHPERKIGG